MLENHLGGHNNKTHLDVGSLKWLQKEFKVKSLIDIGCGPGGMVQLANELGIDAIGIDGDYTLSRYDPNKFIIHDYTKGFPNLDKKYCLAWSVEFLEHVYEEFMPNYMHTFQQAKYAVITYAPPGWNGHHHVNLQEEDYWVDKFESFGLRYDSELTVALRENSTMNYPKKPKKAFVRNRGLFFRNERL